jgi:hypothetical protein
MASIHKDLRICVLFNDTAKRSDFLMSNIWLMSGELKGEKLLFSLCYKPEGPGYESRRCHWKFSLT